MEKKYSRLYAIVIPITAILSFYVWGIIWEIKDSFSNKFFLYIISIFSSYGFFELVYKSILYLFNRWRPLKKLILGDAYIEGIWSDFYYIRGELRVGICTITQDFFNVSVAEILYINAGEYHGECDWASANLFHKNSSLKLVGLYENSSVTRADKTYGYTLLTIESPEQYSGIFYEVGMKKNITVVSYKISDNILDASKNGLVKKARELFEKYAIEKLGQEKNLEPFSQN